MTSMDARVCTRCARAKSIRGVWYLTPTPMGASIFVCESCYRGIASTVAPLATSS